jgi:RHS repeat-associated protein
MNSANISRTENGQAVTIAASYTYNDDGIRATSSVTTTIGNGSPTTVTTQYLVDWLNSTGYAQTLEEHINGLAAPNRSYLIGLSVFGQTNASGVTSILLSDGQGSTRLLTDIMGAIIARFAYDAYGSLLGTPVGILNVPATSRLYTNQEFDINLLRYNLRARFYDPVSGRFGKQDDFPGTRTSPISLHRYLYSSNDPVNRSDPSGKDDILTIALAVGAFGSLAGAVHGGIMGSKNGILGAIYGAVIGAALGFMAGFAFVYAAGGLAGASVLGFAALGYSVPFMTALFGFLVASVGYK